MIINQYKNLVSYYLKELQGTGHLAFRDMPNIISNLDLKGNLTLDFGCGAGRSSKLLMSMGLDVYGVDIEPSMITQAKLINKDKFTLIKDNSLPFPTDMFDVIFNSFVLFDFPSLQSMIDAFSEMRRVCKGGGYIISVTNSNHLFNKNWLTIRNDFPQNKSLISGRIAKIHLIDNDIELNDYFWREQDYHTCFKEAGLVLKKTFYPLGSKHDGYDWKDEYIFPPYAIFVCSLGKL
ncbi:MAG: class I SAM-dependent methyltransferase [Gammaproteobacteria bacterium]